MQTEQLFENVRKSGEISPSNLHAYVPYLRPHIHRRERKIFFMISKRPMLELSNEEVLLFNSIDGQKTMAELEHAYPGASERIVTWHKAELLELIPPVSAPARPHLVVIEPHMDDAALSVGGRLLHRRGRCRITILSVVKWSIFTSYLTLGRDLLDFEEISELRTRESLLSAKLFSAEHQCLDWSDAPLRFWPAERWSRETAERFGREPQLFTNMVPNSKDVAQLATEIVERLTALKPDELWIPMGLGNHLDHRTTRSACLLALSTNRSRFPNVQASMYEDLPYASTPGHAERIRKALDSCGTKLIRATEDITDVFPEKIRAVSVFASQFKISHMEAGIRSAALRGGRTSGELAESYYQVEGDIHLPSEVQLSRECDGLTALENRAHALIRKRTKQHNITVIALPSGSLGKWKTELESLQSAFPNAAFRFYASDQIAWQAEPGHANVQPKFLNSWRGWLAIFGLQFFRVRTPIIILWRGAYGAVPQPKLKKSVNCILRSLFPFRPVLFARTLTDLSNILGVQPSTGIAMRTTNPEGLAVRPSLSS